MKISHVTFISDPCEQDWEFSGSSCYRVFNASDLEEEKEGKGKQEKMGWFDSLTLCGQFGAHAVSIQTEEELVSFSWSDVA